MFLIKNVLLSCLYRDFIQYKNRSFKCVGCFAKLLDYEIMSNFLYIEFLKKLIAAEIC